MGSLTRMCETPQLIKGFIVIVVAKPRIVAQRIVASLARVSFPLTFPLAGNFFSEERCAGRARNPYLHQVANVVVVLIKYHHLVLARPTA